MPVDALFPIPIYREQLPDAGPLCAEMLPHLHRISAGRTKSQPLVTGDAYSGSNAETAAQYLFLYPQLRPLFDAIHGHVGTFARQLGIDPTREHLYLGRAWVNILRPGGRIALHDHVAAVISGVVYLKTGPNAALRFLDPKHATRRDPHYVGAPNVFNQPHADYPVEEGLLLMFPGHVTHGMRAAHAGEGERVSLSFDCYSVSLSGMSPPPPPRALVDKLWKKLEDEVKGGGS